MPLLGPTPPPTRRVFRPKQKAPREIKPLQVRVPVSKPVTESNVETPKNTNQRKAGAATKNPRYDEMANLKNVKGKQDGGVGENVQQVGSQINWDPTLSHESLGIIGQPCKKPTETAFGDISRQTAKRNRRIVSSNIRRKKFIIWILLFALILIWNGFLDLLLRLNEEEEKAFSISIIKPWMRPALIVEFIMTALAILAMMTKMKFMHRKCLGAFFRVLTGLNNVQYLMAMMALPFGVYFFFTELSTDMKKALINTHGTHAEAAWNITQTERHCCGFHSRVDWQPLPDINVVEYVHETIDDEDNPDKNYIYPSSCCDTNLLIEEDTPCTEFSGLYWTKGCHDVEFNVILDYVVCFLVLMILSFWLNVVVRIRVDKIERYLTIFRPYEMF